MRKYDDCYDKYHYDEEFDRKDKRDDDGFDRKGKRDDDGFDRKDKHDDNGFDKKDKRDDDNGYDYYGRRKKPYKVCYECWRRRCYYYDKHDGRYYC